MSKHNMRISKATSGVIVLLLVLECSATPLVTFTTEPDDGEVGVALGANIVITFSADVALSADTSKKVKIHYDSDGTVAEEFSPTDVTLSSSGTELTINPQSDFLTQTKYYVLMDVGFVNRGFYPFEGISGSTSFDFETVPLTIITRTPADGAVEVPVDTTLQLTFNADIIKGFNDKEVEVYQLDGNALVDSFRPNYTGVHVSGNTLTITLTSELNNRTEYYVKQRVGFVRSLNGNNPIAGAWDTTTWNFKTVGGLECPSLDAKIGACATTCASHADCDTASGYLCCNTGCSSQCTPGITADIDECTAGTHNCDAHATCTNDPVSFICSCNTGYIGDGVTCTIPLTIITRTPADGAIDTPVDTTLQLTFNVDIIKGANDKEVEVYQLDGNALVDSFRPNYTGVHVSGNTLTITLTSELNDQTEYYVKQRVGFVKSLNGNNPIAGAWDTTTWNFKTGGILQYPAPGATDVPIDAVLTLTFSQTPSWTGPNGGRILIRKMSDDYIVANLRPELSQYLDISGTVLSITPPVGLPVGLQYWVEVPDDTLDAMAHFSTTGKNWNFTTTSQADLGLALGNPQGSYIPYTGSTNINASTLEQMTITMQGGVPALEGAGLFSIWRSSDNSLVHAYKSENPAVKWRNNGNINVVLTTPIGLEGGKRYHITVDPGFIRNALFSISDSNTWAFTTLEVIVPTLSSSSPSDGESDVELDSNIEITFSVDILPGPDNLELTLHLANGTVVQTFDTSEGLDISGAVLTIDPTSDLVTQSQYYIVMDSGFVKSFTQGDYAGISDSTTLNFATVPLSITTDPYDGELGVELDANIIITFSADVELTADTSKKVRIHYSDGTVAKQFSPTNSAVTCYGTELTINPKSPLFVQKEYYVLMDPGFVVEAVNGGEFVGISGSTSFNFETVPLTITETVPNNGAVDVLSTDNITITFSASIKATLVKYLSIWRTDGTVVEVLDNQGDAVIGDRTVTLTPTALVVSTEYYILMEAGFVTTTEDMEFAGVLVTSQFTFETAPLTITASVPDKKAGNVLPTDDITITFSVPIKANTVEKHISICRVSDGGEVERFNNQGDAVIGNRTVRITPTSLGVSTWYFILIDQGFVKTVEGDIEFDGVFGYALFFDAVPISAFAFETATLPYLTLTTPSSGALDVALHSDIYLTFNTNIQLVACTPPITISTAGVVWETPQLGAGGIWANNNLLTIIPSSPFDRLTHYSLNIGSGCVQTDQNISYGGHVLYFRTTPLTIASTVPADGATDVGLSEDITIIFSVPIQANPTPKNIAIEQEGSLIATFNNQGEATIAGTTVTIKPTTLVSTAYTVVIPEGFVTTTDGQFVFDGESFSFTTGCGSNLNEGSRAADVRHFYLGKGVDHISPGKTTTKEERQVLFASLVGGCVVGAACAVLVIKVLRSQLATRHYSTQPDSGSDKEEII